MISTKAVIYQYQDGNPIAYPDLLVEEGHALLIIGKSGCGKTTLLHLLGGLIKPIKGEVFIQNQALSVLSNKALDQFRGQHIGIVFQKPYFVQALSVKENILLAPYLSKQKMDKSKLQKLAETLGISHLLNKLPASLSQGEQQRVSIARAIIHSPKVVLADEPTSSLDDENTAIVAHLLMNLAAAYGAALIVVTHDERLKQLIPQQLLLS